VWTTQTNRRKARIAMTKTARRRVTKILWTSRFMAGG